MNRLIMITLLMLSANGCTSVYFYETEKVSVTLEGRPDPTAPVSGNIGLKQRVVLVAPATGTNRGHAPQASNSDESKEPGNARTQGNQPVGDALSVINSFRFQIHPKDPGQWFPRMTIDGALITGRPAADLGQAQTSRAIGALSGVDVAPIITHDIGVLRLIYGGAKSLQSQVAAGSPQRQKLDGLINNLNKLDDLAPQTYTVLMFDSIENGQFKARPGKDKGAAVAGDKGFDRVLTYWADLDLSITNLARLRDDSEKPEVERLAAGQKLLEVGQAKESLERNLRASDALAQLRDFWREIGG